MALTATLGVAAAMLGNVELGLNAGVTPVASESYGQATRYWYVSNRGAPYIPQTFRGGWHQTSNATNCFLGGTGDATATTLSVAKGVATNPYRVCVARAVSGRLAQQLISGFVQVTGAQCVESNADANIFWYVHLYVLAGDSDSVRGTLLGDYEDPTNEWPTVAASTSLGTQQALSPVSCQRGDRLVAELGYESNAAVDRTGGFRVGFSSTSLTFSNYIQEAGLLWTVQSFDKPTSVLTHQRLVCGFRPKAVILTGWRESGGTTNITNSFGWTDGVRQACRSGAAADASAAADNTAGDSTTCVILETDRSEVVLARATLASVNDDGVTLQWTVNSGSALVTQYGAIFIGGDDVDCYAGRLAGPTATTTSTVYNVNELGWTPDAILFMSSRLQINQTETITSSGEWPSLGWATPTTQPIVNHYAGTGELQGANPSQSYSRQITTASIYVPDVTNSVTLGDPALEGSVTAAIDRGFSVTYSTIASAGDAFCPFYLAIRGVSAYAFALTQPAVGVQLAQAYTFPFCPKLMFFQSIEASAIATTVRTQGYLTQSIGGFSQIDATGSSIGLEVGIADAVTPTRNFSLRNTSTGELLNFDQTNAGAPTSLATCSLGSRVMTRDGPPGWTLTWSTTDVNERQVVCLVLGDDLDHDRSAFEGTSGAGTPTLGSNPAADGTLTTATTPLAFLTIQTDSGEKRYGKATISAPSTYQVPGWIEGRVSRIGPVRRSLSDWQGTFETGTCQVELIDHDRVLRGLASTGVLLNKRVDLFLATATQITAGTVPRRIFSGLIRNYRPSTGLTFVLDLEDALGARIGKITNAKQLPSTTLDRTTFPNLPEALIGKPEPLCYGLLSDETSGAAAVGVVPALFVGRRALTHTNGRTRNWDEYLISRGAVKRIHSWFARKYGLRDPGRPEIRIKMPAQTENFDFLIPGHKGWAAWTGSTATYRTFNSKRYTVIYCTGQRSDEAIAGNVPLAVNLEGIEDVGDGTGTLITSLPYQALHLITNFVLQTATGAWLSIPTVGSPAYAQIDSGSFTNVKTASEARVSGGYLGAFVLGWNQTASSAQDALAQLCKNGDFSIGVNRQGQVMASMEDSTAVAALTLRDVTDVLAGSLEIDHAISTQLFNEIRYRYGRRYVAEITNLTPSAAGLLPGKLRPDTHEFLSGDLTSSDATSITNHGETRTDDLSFEFVRSAATVNSVVARRLARLKNAPKYAQFQTGLIGTGADLGDVVNLTHFAGLSATGYAGTEDLRVIAQVIDPEQFTVTLECHDVTGL